MRYLTDDEINSALARGRSERSKQFRSIVTHFLKGHSEPRSTVRGKS